MEIYDDSVKCVCNDRRYTNLKCSYKCKCYCHIPILWRNLVWKFYNGDNIKFKDLLKKEEELKQKLGEMK